MRIGQDHEIWQGLMMTVGLENTLQTCGSDRSINEKLRIDWNSQPKLLPLFADCYQEHVAEAYQKLLESGFPNTAMAVLGLMDQEDVIRQEE